MNENSEIYIAPAKPTNFTVLYNDLAEDPNVSWGAKGLWWFLRTKGNIKPDWKVLIKHLVKIYPQNGGRKHAIYEMLKELRKAGFCKLEKPRKIGGRYSGARYVIYAERQEIKEMFPEDEIVRSGQNEQPKEFVPQGNILPSGQNTFDQYQEVSLEELNEFLPEPDLPETVKTISGKSAPEPDFRELENQDALINIDISNKLASLSQLPISEAFKKKWLKEFSLEQIAHALAFYKAKISIEPDFVPDKTWAHFLASSIVKNWEIPEKVEYTTEKGKNPPPSEDELKKVSDENKKIAINFSKNVENLLSAHERIEIYGTYMTFKDSKKAIFRQIYFYDKDFKNELRGWLQMFNERKR